MKSTNAYDAIPGPVVPEVSNHVRGPRNAAGATWRGHFRAERNQTDESNRIDHQNVHYLPPFTRQRSVATMRSLPRSTCREVGAVHRHRQAAEVFRMRRSQTGAFHKHRRLLPLLPAAIQPGSQNMIDLHLHLRGEQTERRQFPVVPVVGSYIIGPGPERRLWGGVGGGG